MAKSQSKRQIIVTVIGVALAGTAGVIGYICASENYYHETTGDVKVLRLKIALLTTSILLALLPVLNLCLDTDRSDPPPARTDVSPGLGSNRPPWLPPGPIDNAGRYPGGWYVEDGKVLRDVISLGLPAGGGEPEGEATLRGRRRRGIVTSNV